MPVMMIGDDKGDLLSAVRITLQRLQQSVSTSNLQNYSLVQQLSRPMRGDLESIKIWLDKSLGKTKYEGTIVTPLMTAIGALVLLYLWQRLWGDKENDGMDSKAVKFIWEAPKEIEKDWIGKPCIYDEVEVTQSAHGKSIPVHPSASIDAHVFNKALLPKTNPCPGIPPESQGLISCYAPATGFHLRTIFSLSPAEIRSSINRAEVAQRQWGNSPWSTRRKVFRSLLKWCVDDCEKIAKVASRDTGKTMVDAAFGEILTTAEKLRWTIGNGETVLKTRERSTNWVLAHKVSYVKYDPLGVVAAVVSWNYPFHNLLSPIIAALASGNSIVVKPSENVAWSSLIFIQAVRSILTACNVDPELVQCCVCLPDSVEALTGDSRIRHITFIGSEEVGKKVAVKGASNGIPVLLELGGKDPCIILPSADLNFFYATWMRAAFQAAGQNCIGVERFIVASLVYDQFVSEMTTRVSRLEVGDALSAKRSQVDVGAMVTDRLFARLEHTIQEAVSQGARVLVGGSRFKHKDYPNGHYFQPTLIVDVTPSMRIATEELFAPVMTVMRYDDQNLQEAVHIANATKYGLGSSVFGRNKKDCQFIVDHIQAGMVCTNDFGVFYLNQSLPFGGRKSSGYGRFAGEEGLIGLCSPKAVTKDRFHGLIQTSIPPLLAYPIVSASASWAFLRGLIRLMYGVSLKERLLGIWGLATANRQMS